MSLAHDALVLSNEQQVTAGTVLKRILRTVSNGNVILSFDDRSQLKYVRCESWRQDKLEILQDEQ